MAFASRPIRSSTLRPPRSIWVLVDNLMRLFEAEIKATVGASLEKKKRKDCASAVAFRL